ncbi:MAG: peptide ABC transporter substrate-binding protein [Bacteroidia bacterium]|nr:peptide ABC transporter substrate-binding protein [Bacteroidia bacterium]
MSKFFYCFGTVLSIFFISCNSDKKGNKIESGKELPNGAFYGGFLRVNEVENFKSLEPVAINDLTSFHLASQVYEGLVKFDPQNLQHVPGLATRWEFSSDNKSITLFLRKGVKFHDADCFPEGKGREVTIEDVKFSLNNLCRASSNNNQFEVTFHNKVVGADEAYEASKSGKVVDVSGIKILNDSTIKIELINPSTGFLNILAMPGCYIYPKEAVQKYGNDLRVKAVGTGPFFIDMVKEGEVVMMKRNPNYWKKDENGYALPYLDGIKWTFIHEKKSEILKFKSKEIDLIDRIPVEMFQDVMGKLEEARKGKNEFQIITSPAFNTYFYGIVFGVNPVLDKKEVRKAFIHAIDRQKISNFTIQGEGYPAEYGFVPYSEVFEKQGYNYKAIPQYPYDPQKAKEYLKAAGFENGKGFPEITLEINSGGGDRNTLVAEVVQTMLKENLNVNVKINIVPMSEHITNVQSAKVEFFRFGWVADYPDPETFLNQFLSNSVPATLQEKSYSNFTRYKNPRFDSIFNAANLQNDPKLRMEMLSKAEALLMEDVPVIPLFYDEVFYLEQNNVRGVPANPMKYHDFSFAYLIPEEKLSKK